MTDTFLIANNQNISSYVNPGLTFSVLSGTHVGTSFKLPHGEYTLGSGEDNDLIFPDTGVLDKHLILTVLNTGEVKVTPIEGVTIIEGEEISSPAILQDGEVLIAGLLSITLGALNPGKHKVSFLPPGAISPQNPLLPQNLVEKSLDSSNYGDYNHEMLETKDDLPDTNSSNLTANSSSNPSLKDKNKKNEDDCDPIKISPSGFNDDDYNSEKNNSNNLRIASKNHQKQPNKRTFALISGILFLVILLSLLLRSWVNVSTENPRIKETLNYLAQKGFENLSVLVENGNIWIEGSVKDDSELTELIELVKNANTKPERTFLKIKVKNDLSTQASDALSAYGFFPFTKLNPADGSIDLAMFVRDDDIAENTLTKLKGDVPDLKLGTLNLVTQKDIDPFLNKTLKEKGITTLKINYEIGKIELINTGETNIPNNLLSKIFIATEERFKTPIAFVVSDKSGDKSPEVFFPFPNSPLPPFEPIREIQMPLDPIMGNLKVTGVTLTPVRYLSTSKGQRLFEGSVLPSGYSILSIEFDTLTLSKEGELISYPLFAGDTENNKS
jgi:type III secretion protein D